VLVDEHIAACVNVLTGVHSVFSWQDAREEASETLAIVKTTRQRFADLAVRVKSLHSYSVPEIIALPIVSGDAAYLQWIGDTVQKI
jgi:periplasmic divalent cation tolerance protein